jgi:hypothetical protein
MLFVIFCVILSTAVAFRGRSILRSTNIGIQQQRLHTTFVSTRLFNTDPVKNGDEERTVQKTESDPSGASGISSSMRERLLRENASLGGSANEKSTNPILIVAGVVAVLAVASSIIGAI